MVLVSVVFGTFVCLLDSTIVNTALPKIQAVFGGTFHEVSFIATAFTMAAAVVKAEQPEEEPADEQSAQPATA